MKLGWIDFSKTERDKTLIIISTLSETGTLDEIGIAPIRDSFSRLFFPGTSTIQTRAKYFLIVPYALKDIERDYRNTPSEVQKQLNKVEKECGKILYESNKSEAGLIGKNALAINKWVKRTPSDIYWAGIKRYGIFTGDNLSLSDYIRLSCALKREKRNQISMGNRNDKAEENDQDDRDAGDLIFKQFWKLPVYKTDWRHNLSMQLTKEEAIFLKQQIIETCQGSILACILENDIEEFLDCKSFQDIGKIIHRFPKELQDEYMLAISFSEFVYCIRTVYNIIISDGKNEVADEELKRLLPNFPNYANIDLDEIWRLHGPDNNPLLRRFLDECQDYIKEKNIVSLKECITRREVHLKGGNRAKTKQPGAYTDWLGGGMLDYRFSIGKTIIEDIMEGEKNIC